MAVPSKGTIRKAEHWDNEWCLCEYIRMSSHCLSVFREVRSKTIIHEMGLKELKDKDE
jgi:hypothetical protein